MKKRSKTLKFDSIEEFCQMKYGRIINCKEIPIRECSGYYLTVMGDLLHCIERGKYFNLVQYKQPKKKKGRRRLKTGFSVDHYYQQGKRLLTKSRGKMMLVTFSNWSLNKAMKYKMYPKDGNNSNVSLGNIVPYKDEAEARRNVHGIPQKRKKITAIETLKIQKSKKTNKELAEEYGVHLRTIYRHRNGELLSI